MMTKPVHLHVKIDAAVLRALDAAAASLAWERPGLDVTRADVVRMALALWLRDHATTAAAKGPNDGGGGV